MLIFLISAYFASQVGQHFYWQIGGFQIHAQVLITSWVVITILLGSVIIAVRNPPSYIFRLSNAHARHRPRVLSTCTSRRWKPGCASHSTASFGPVTCAEKDRKKPNEPCIFHLTVAVVGNFFQLHKIWSWGSTP